MAATPEELRTMCEELAGELATALRDNLYLRDKAAGVDALRKENDLQRGDLRNERDKVRHLEEDLEKIKGSHAEAVSREEKMSARYEDLLETLAASRAKADAALKALRALLEVM